MINSIVLSFDDFKQKRPSILYQPQKGVSTKGHGDPLSAAYVMVATTYINYIVGNFYKHLVYYLYVKLKVIYDVSLTLFILVLMTHYYF